MSRKPRRMRKGQDLSRPFPQTELRTQQQREYAQEILHYLAIGLLLSFGIYQSVLFYAHIAVPNPDFTGFIQTGKEILSFEIPTNYKRAPVLGCLQVLIGKFVDSPHPELTAGWILNAALSPFSLVLLYLIGRKLIGFFAPFMALICFINPWLVLQLSEPIAEITLLFFTLLTTYLIISRSRLCYFFAAITAMVRYEGAVLILAAFLMDVFTRKGKHEFTKALAFSVAASLPLGLWMLGTFLHWRAGSGGHYLKEFGEGGSFFAVFVSYLNMIWKVTFYPLFLPSPASSADLAGVIQLFSKAIVACSFAFGCIYGIAKKNLNILVLLIFLLPYLCIHAMHSFVLPRFCLIINWIVMLVVCFGIKSLFDMIRTKNEVPPLVCFFFGAIVVIAAVIWLSVLIPFISQTSRFSPKSSSIIYIVLACILLFCISDLIFSKARHLLRNIVFVSILLLMIVSNQIALPQVVGAGTDRIEFRMLAGWYLKNARPDERMLTTMSNVVGIFAPAHRESFVFTGAIKADTPERFVTRCREQRIDYVAWDSRLGLCPNDRYYKSWGLKNIAFLAEPKSGGPYEFVDRIEFSERQFINIFRLKPADR